MLKKVLLVLITLAVILDAKNMVRMKKVETAPTKQEATELAFWYMFEDALGKVLSSSSYDSNTADSFKSDMEKDFLEFRKTHFRSTKVKCNDLKEDGFECRVIASIDLDRLKSKVAKKNNSSTTMGKNALEDTIIVLIDDVDSDISKDFTKYVHAISLESGTDLRVEKKGTQVGVKGNKCESIKKQQKKYKRKGSSYQSVLDSINIKLKQCEENSDVKYLFKLTKLKFALDAEKDRYGSYTGSLTYALSMVNVQTGREANAIRPKTVESFHSNIDSLKAKLYEKAASLANAEMTSNMLKNTAKKQRKKKKRKVQHFEYMYTITVMGITNDADDRHKRKIIKESIKALGSKAKKNTKESSDFEQVYNFGSNEELDMEEFGDELYDMADSLGFRIKFTDKGDDIVVVQFQ
ncbi:hypothetical protein JHD48_05820 [Sulfurimonas sp. SAG-AH-194-I05]|nr:hypothetical protein [Sulfurimonas sp. SAG-AH-194-I05]MDF1875243.1 hypothetical protein [Sulfurimonas sp. SAG-AH-194-I05]